MDNVRWVVAYYPAGIVIFGVLCQFLVYVPDNESLSHLTLSKTEETHMSTKNVNIVSQQRRNTQDLPAPLNPEDQKLPTPVHSRSTVWFAAFWLSLQLYSLLRMGSKISIVEQEKPGFIWPAMICLFIPTFMTLMSIVRLGEALERVEAHRKLSTGLRERHFLNMEILGMTVLLILIPWIQAGWVLVMG